jgi:prepilin-type N-terminal cleavage/methylation domain-containing protein
VGHRFLYLSRAFTLIELLVVISIISLLIAILLPSLSKARQASRRIACLSNMRQMGLAINTYVTDNGDELPTSGDSGSCSWPAKVFYSNVPTNLFICPSDKTGGKSSYSITGVGTNYVYKQLTGTSIICGLYQYPLFQNQSKKFLLVEGHQSSRSSITSGTYSVLEQPWSVRIGSPWCHDNEGANYMYLDMHGKYIRTPCPAGSSWAPTLQNRFETWEPWYNGFVAKND